MLELLRCSVDARILSFIQSISTQLQHLLLTDCYLWCDSFTFIRYMISICPTSLVSLSVDRGRQQFSIPATTTTSTITPTTTTTTTTTITTITNSAIETLHLSDVYSLPELFAILDHCPKLTQLSVDTTHQFHPAILPYCSRLTHFRWCMGARPWIHSSSSMQQQDDDAPKEKSLYGLDIEAKDLELFMQRSFQHLRFLGLHSVRYLGQRAMLLRILEQAQPTLNHAYLGLNPSTAEGGVLNALHRLHCLQSLHMTLELNEPWHDRILPLLHGIQDIAHASSHTMESIALDVPFPILKDLDDKADVLVSMGLIPFLKKVRMDVSNVQETSLLAFLERADELRDLTIESVKPIFSYRLLSAIASAMPHLRHFKISYCPQIEAAGIRRLADHHHHHNQQGLSLTFVCCQFDDNGACVQYAKEKLGKANVIYTLDEDDDYVFGAYPNIQPPDP